MMLNESQKIELYWKAYNLGKPTIFMHEVMLDLLEGLESEENNDE